MTQGWGGRRNASAPTQAKPKADSSWLASLARRNDKGRATLDRAEECLRPYTGKTKSRFLPGSLRSRVGRTRVELRSTGRRNASAPTQAKSKADSSWLASLACRNDKRRATLDRAEECLRPYTGKIKSRFLLARWRSRVGMTRVELRPPLHKQNQKTKAWEKRCQAPCEAVFRVSR